MDRSPDVFVKPAEGVVFRRLQKGKGGVLLKLDTGAYHSLNETGAMLWEMLNEGKSLSDLMDQLRAATDDAPDHLKSDIDEFVNGLHARGLLSLGSIQGNSGPLGP